MAPNHFLNEPWRFRLFGKEGIAKCCALNDQRAALFSGSVLTCCGSALCFCLFLVGRILSPSLSLPLDLFSHSLRDRVPQMMVVSCEPTTSKDGERWNVKALEDHAATACAVQNFMLSLASEGFGGSRRYWFWALAFALTLSVACSIAILATLERRLQMDDRQDGNLRRQDVLRGSRHRHGHDVSSRLQVQ